MSDAKFDKKPVDYSAGVILPSLIPEDERVALVLNKRSGEVKTITKEEFQKRPKKYESVFVEERENDIVISFIQPDGFGSPFGKEELEDGKDRLVTAMREAEEETGTPMQDRIFKDLSYTEQPDYRSAYSNTVFGANGMGFAFDKEKMCDPYVDPEHSGMWELRRLPIPRRRKERRDNEGSKQGGKKRVLSPIEKGIGIYQATLRRIIAIHLQLNVGHLSQMGRPGAENAEDLVQMVINQIPYRNFFSPRMLKMLAGLKRLDVAVERLKRDEGVIRNGELAAHISANLILWLPYKPSEPESLLNQAMRALYERCDPQIQPGIGSWISVSMERREKVYLVSLDKQGGLTESDEKLVVVDDDELEEESPFDLEKKARERKFAEAVREKEDD